jgi:hypothetical protein
MNVARLYFSFFTRRDLHPDRVRSLLEYLKVFHGPFQTGGFPANLYAAAEKLVARSGPLDPAPFIQTAAGENNPLKIEIRKDHDMHIFSLDLGPAHEAAAYFASPKILDLFRAGARMTAALCAAVSLEPKANAVMRLRLEDETLKLHAPPLALWISATLATRPPGIPVGYADVVDWDGAVLMLHPSVVDTQDLRQALRRMIHDRVKADDGVLRVFRAALTSTDWELRATAMLGAARLDFQTLGPDVRRIPLPDTSREGLGPEDRRTLRAMHRAVLMLLSGGAAPPQDQEDQGTQPGLRAHLLRCVAGLPVPFHDEMFLLSHALTEPLPIAYPRPESLPVGLEETDYGEFRTSKSGIEFIWVPPIPHWLGMGPSIRRISPRSGFFLSKWPVRSSRSGEYYSGTWEDAQRICRDLAAGEGVPLNLPTADEWEMAARGPDGRRFPWGNGLERNMLGRRSPWGATDCSGVIGQWTQDGWICGVQENPRCSSRHAQVRMAAVRLRIGE